MISKDYAWAKILGHMENRLTSVTVSAYLDDAELLDFNDRRIIIYSPTEFRREYIKLRCMEYLREAVRELFDYDSEILIFGDAERDELFSKGTTINTLHLNPQYTFDSFVVGKSNQFAYNAAMAITDNPGQIYNPLYIYGPPGVGKTHLLYAIANKILQKTPDINLVYIKGEEFTNELISALRNGKNAEFRYKYRNADLFLIDDVQFIAGKESTQEEFFHTFNALHENHKQIVLTSDRKPSDMLTLESRLSARFEWGLLASIDTPDYETRMAIIQKKAQSLDMKLSDEVCNYIAINVTNNVRQIEGTVKKIKAYRDLNDMPLDLSHVSRAIDDMFKKDGNSLPTPNLIISQVCKFYSIEENILRSSLKNKGTAEARQVAIYLIRKLTNLSTTDIGKELNKDHSTVIYSINKVEAALQSGESELKNHIQDITANIHSCL